MKKIVLLILLFSQIKIFAEEGKEKLLLDQYSKVKSEQEFQGFLRKLILLPPKEKDDLVKYIINNSIKHINLLLALSNNKDKTFELLLNKLKAGGIPPESNDKACFVLKTFMTVYPISLENQQNFTSYLRDALKKNQNPLTYIAIVKDLRLKEAIPELLLCLNNKKNKYQYRFDALRALEACGYTEFNKLQKKIIEELVKCNDKSAINEYCFIFKDKRMKLYLIILKLESAYPEFRMKAVKELRKKTKQNFGFNPMGSEKERAAVVKKWKEWWTNEW